MVHLGIRWAVAAVALACASTMVGAAEVTLRFATISTPTSPVPAGILHPWAKAVNERGKGVLRLDVRDGLSLANMTNHYSRVLDDVIQIAWGLQVTVSGKFKLSEVAELPFMFDDGEVGSQALWRLYKSGLVDADYDQIVPLMLTTITPVGLHFRKPLKTLDDLQGVKLQTVNRIYAQAALKLGATPISLPLNSMYEAFQRGTVEGAAIGWTAFPPFRLDEVTAFHVDVAFGTSVGMVYMAKKRFDQLPEAARKVLMESATEEWSKRFGAFWDQVSSDSRERIKGSGKHTVVRLTSAQAASWEKKLAPLADDWAKEHSNGAKILATYRKLVSEVKAGR